MIELVSWALVVPARDESSKFINWDSIMGVSFSYYILYYIIFTDFLFWVSLSFHVIASRRISQNIHKNIILLIYEYYIILKHQYRYLGPV
jgi:hypothetical protein